MLISPFTPLFFDTRRSDGIASRYVQTFAESDRILLQVFRDGDDVAYGAYIEEIDGETRRMACMAYAINDDTKMFSAEITGLPEGCYRVFLPLYFIGSKQDSIDDLPTLTTDYAGTAAARLTDVTAERVIDGVRYAGVISAPFRITDDPNELAQTTLIQYSNKDNRQRTDALFIVSGMRYFFDFRVPGGFKDGGWTFAVDNEQFTTPDGDIVELYALETTQRRFTMGWQEGVPVTFAELLNRLLTCHYVYFDGVRYTRKDAATPEMTTQIDGLDSFVFSQQLQRVNNLNPTIENGNHLIMRRGNSTDDYRAINSTDNRIIY